MNSFAEKKYRNGFLLNEEGLIKLKDIINQRRICFGISEDIVFKIHRKDHLVYETKDSNEILKEENSSLNQIQKLEINLNQANFRLLLSFDLESSISINIESDNRDNTFILFSEITSHIESKIVSQYNFEYRVGNFLFGKNSLLKPIIFPIAGISIIVPILHKLTRPIKVQITQDKIARMSNEEILKFLAESVSQSNTQLNETGNFLFTISIFTLAVIFIPMFTFLFYARYSIFNSFLIGEQIKVHEKKLAFRKNFLWGIVIASIVSIVTGVIVNFLTFKK